MTKIFWCTMSMIVLFPLTPQMTQTNADSYFDYTGRMHNGYYWEELLRNDSAKSSIWTSAERNIWHDSSSLSTVRKGDFGSCYLRGLYDEILGESINDSSIIRKGFTFLTMIQWARSCTKVLV
jgi:hypothetical protein